MKLDGILERGCREFAKCSPVSVTVWCPDSLRDEVERIVKSGKKGYKSIAEFIKEAIREKMKSEDTGR